MRKQYSSEVKQTGDRRREFVISTTDPDREGDRILGWRLSNYRRNPVVLWAHQHRQPPVAKATEVRWTGSELRSTAKFPDEGVYPFADTVLEMLDRGVLNAASVGFDVLEGSFERNRYGGLDFDPAELLEWSIVPIPANADSLVQEARAKGIDTAPLRKRREQMVKRCAGEACGLQDGKDAATELEELLDEDRAADAELVNELLELTSDELGEAVAAALREEWRKQVTPRDGSLGP